jgi:adenine/guanine phosphoribosyltransferase-like PRPP-binding protein
MPDLNHYVTPRHIAQADTAERTDIVAALEMVGLPLADALADYVRALFAEHPPTH